MNALIIGGNKFFGLRLAKILLDNGHQVTLLNRGNTEDGLGNRVSRMICDRTDQKNLENVMKDKSFDIVFDQVCYDYPSAKIACEVFNGKTKRYVFTSTKSVYDQGENLVEELVDPLKQQLDKFETWETNYGVAKRQAEAAFTKLADFSVTMIRFPFVLGEEDPSGRLNWHVNRIKEGRPIYLPSPDSKVNVIHAQDAARTLYEVGLSSFEGPINAAGAGPLVLRDLISMIEQKYEKKAILLESESKDDWSPYGVSASWWMNIDKMKKTFFTPMSPKSFLPDLI
ncbi:MAG: NAD-dependent epimerase/dehydratase family protein [Deltaproteobacteria bacterium]|nr:MAG: NAD-dependent epimerase/dehydratase family protein [Deltaproteobacteria bacterium]